MKKKSTGLFSKKVLAGAAIAALAVSLYLFIILTGTGFSSQTQKTPKAFITVLSAGMIPTANIQLLEVSPTPTSNPAITYDGIAINSYVSIEGTEGSGLRIRSLPGLSSDTEFIANESEVYIVIGGPKNADDMLWWNLATPYDETRQGWAASGFLTPIQDN